MRRAGQKCSPQTAIIDYSTANANRVCLGLLANFRSFVQVQVQRERAALTGAGVFRTLTLESGLLVQREDSVGKKNNKLQLIGVKCTLLFIGIILPLPTAGLAAAAGVFNAAGLTWVAKVTG